MRRIFLLLVLVGHPVHAQFQMGGGKGQVLDTTSKGPIEGATVTLECRSSRFLHGSDKVRDLAVVTDRNGEYEFSFANVRGCDFAYVRAAKSGYQESDWIHVGYGYSTYGAIPKLRYLTPDADVVMLRLAYVTPSRPDISFNADGTHSAYGSYRTWYGAFFQAKRIAQTDRERQFVRHRYCETLPKLYAAMTDADKAKVAIYTYSYNWRGKYASGKHDYDAEVASYCR